MTLNRVQVIARTDSSRYWYNNGRLNLSKLGVGVEIITKQVATLFQELSRARVSRASTRKENKHSESKRERNSVQSKDSRSQTFQRNAVRATTNRSITIIKIFHFLTLSFS